MIFHEGGFFVFGGEHSDPSDSPAVRRFDEEKREWSTVGELRKHRQGHGVIYDGESFIVAGGNSSSIENCIWKHEEFEMVCNELNQTLQDYTLYPELAIVHDDFENEC